MTDTDSITRDLSQVGITRPGRVYANLSAPRLVEEALARGEGTLTPDGALVAKTGKRTGRSPGDKFLVQVRRPRERRADRLGQGQPADRARALRAAAGARERLLARPRPVRGRRLRRRRSALRPAHPHGHRVRLARAVRPAAVSPPRLPLALAAHQPEWTIIGAPRFYADPAVDGTKSETAVIMDVEQKIILICGTEYAGENKKSIFSALNYVLPLQGVLPMHCSANIGADGDVALFFGLSGTGKTTLSADPAAQADRRRRARLERRRACSTSRAAATPSASTSRARTSRRSGTPSASARWSRMWWSTP